MNAITRTLKARITCAEKRRIVCHRHAWHTQPVEILTFILDSMTPVHIERDEGAYNVKIGEDRTWVQIPEGEVIKILEAQ